MYKKIALFVIIILSLIGIVVLGNNININNQPDKIDLDVITHG